MRRIGALILLLTASSCALSPPAPTKSDEVAQLVAQGISAAQSQDFAVAMQALTRALELDAGCVEALRWRGHCENFVGEYPQAIADYERAIALDPGYAWSHYALGMAQHNLGHFESALGHYSRAIELDPQFLKAHEWRGFTRKLVGDFQGAVEDLSYCARYEPDRAWCWTELAKSYVGAGEFKAAQQAFERALTLTPDDAELCAQLGYLAAIAGRTDDALAHFRRATDLGAQPQTYPRVWTWLLRALEQGEAAAADAELEAWLGQAASLDRWEEHLVRYLLGEGDDAGLRSFAEQQSRVRAQAGQPVDDLGCEACVYAGVRRELAGELAAARRLYEEAWAMPVPMKWERLLAKRRLDALASK